jgi:hypothetical protein
VDFDLILNELSLQNPAPNEQEAQERMSELIKTIKAVKAQGVNVSLRTKENFHTTLLAPKYPLRRWLNDADQVERIFIKTLATKAPFSTDIENSEIQDIENNASLSEFRHQGEMAIGLGIAYVLDTIAISLLSEKCWDCSRLHLEFRCLDRDEEVVCELVEIIHASRSSHVHEHADLIKKIQERICQEVSDGVELWNRKEELFPRLEFCEDVSKQMQNLYPGNPMLRQVIKRLFELEDYCKIWTDGAFNSDNIPSKATPESESRLRQFKQELTFKCPDGEKRIFSWHLRMTGAGAWRLHFSEELGPGKIIIGYIGSKIR